MVILEFILLALAIFVTLLWVTKLTTDFASGFIGGLATDEERIRDASYRVLLSIVMSILWTSLIIIFW